MRWDPALLKYFRIRPSALPEIVSCQVYREVEHGPLKGVKIGRLIDDQRSSRPGVEPGICIRMKQYVPPPAAASHLVQPAAVAVADRVSSGKG